MATFLVGIGNMEKFGRREVSASPFLLGRTQECQIRLGHDEFVSREHCEVILRDGATIVHDCKSRNGTKVNNKPIGDDGERELCDGDILQVGECRFRVEITNTGLTESSASNVTQALQLPEDSA